MRVRIRIVDGVCSDGIHSAGQEFIVEDTTPEGICIDAWGSIAPYLTPLRAGGNFPWADEEGVAVIHCPDPDGIRIELRRME